MEICPRTGKPCRHVSREVERRIQRVGVIETGLLEKREISLGKGAFCNNDGRTYVEDLNECPIPAAVSVPLVPYEISELDWARIKGVA